MTAQRERKRQDDPAEDRRSPAAGPTPETASRAIGEAVFEEYRPQQRDPNA